jgi:hypothetical protein
MGVERVSWDETLLFPKYGCIEKLGREKGKNWMHSVCTILSCIQVVDVSGL